MTIRVEVKTRFRLCKMGSKINIDVCIKKKCIKDVIYKIPLLCKIRRSITLIVICTPDPGSNLVLNSVLLLLNIRNYVYFGIKIK